VAAYVADLRARDRRAEQVAKPFSDDDVRRMSDEVETAEEVAEALRRVGKVVKLASFAAADMPVDADGMTTEERQLFDDLVDRISENKSRVLDVLAGEAPPASTDAVPTDDATPLGDATNAPPSTDESATADSAPPAPDPEPPRPKRRLAKTTKPPGPGRAPTRSRAPWAVRTTRWPTPSTPTDVTTDGESRATDGSPADGNATADDASAGDGPTPFRRSPPRREHRARTRATTQPRATTKRPQTLQTPPTPPTAPRSGSPATWGRYSESTSGSTTSQTRMS